MTIYDINKPFNENYYNLIINPLINSIQKRKFSTSIVERKTRSKNNILNWKDYIVKVNNQVFTKDLLKLNLKRG